jgi:hypothetical protein
MRLRKLLNTEAEGFDPPSLHEENLPPVNGGKFLTFQTITKGQYPIA